MPASTMAEFEDGISLLEKKQKCLQICDELLKKVPNLVKFGIFMHFRVTQDSLGVSLCKKVGANRSFECPKGDLRSRRQFFNQIYGKNVW